MNVHLEQSVDVRDAHVRNACAGGHHPGIVDEQIEREIAGGQRRRDQGTSLLVGDVGPDQGATVPRYLRERRRALGTANDAEDMGTACCEPAAQLEPVAPTSARDQGRADMHAVSSSRPRVSAYVIASFP